MKTLPRTLALLALFLSSTFTGFCADDSLKHVQQAQTLLGAEVWSQIVRIENSHRASRYPRELHALVFELADILWFYSPVNGTQSFSLHRGRLAQEKADFAPLLRDIDRGFTRWTVVENVPVAAGARVSFPNGCFIESVVALRDRRNDGREIVRPQLLSFYTGPGNGDQGHTVLAYETADRVEVIDSAQAGRALSFPMALARDAIKLAQAVLGHRVAQARLFPLQWPMTRPQLVSAITESDAGGARAG